MPARPWTPVSASRATDARAGHPAENGLVRVPVLPAVAEFEKFRRELRRPDAPSSASRVRRRMVEERDDGADLASTATMFVHPTGGNLRTFTCPLGHERGYFPSKKSGRMQYFEGRTQELGAAILECDHRVRSYQLEGRRFEFVLDGRKRTYTCDADVETDDGREILEYKKSDRDLRDEDYLLTLAGVSEICRLVGFRFRLVMASDMFVSRYHRARVELFASRRFVTIGPEHIRRLEGHAYDHGLETDHGTLMKVLDPDRPRTAKAVIQGLVVRRRVEIDLREPVNSLTPVTIR